MLEQQQQQPPPKKRGRLGPETWKLRGAARPAWEVYDFDTRYVDPYIQEHEEAKDKAKRSRNLFVIYKGQFGHVGLSTSTSTSTTSTSTLPPQPACKNFLSKLVQLGHLCVEAKKFKSAREAFLECIKLEGNDELEYDHEHHHKNIQIITTNAESQLMRMYMEANRPDSARRLWERFPKDTSVWIRYSASLVEYVSWNLLHEHDSTQTTAEQLLACAIQSNPYCAYYIAFHDTFDNVMEFTNDIEDGETLLEEAIEYCSSEQMGSWIGTDGAIQWI